MLALDANVYIPGKKAGSDPDNPNYYGGAGRGYNYVLSHKKHLIPWVEEVAGLARKLDKTLIVFSHYPMVEFNDDASSQLHQLLGPDAMQLYRVPEEEVARIFADAGVRVHFGGHMHINDTGIRNTPDGNSLVNVQIPSLAAYIPAYKLLTIRDSEVFEVETIVIDSVPRFNEMFEFYLQEYEFLEQSASPTIWDKDILKATSYREFTGWHLKELVRLRFLPGEWPSDFRDWILGMSGEDLMSLAPGSHLALLEQSIEWTGFDLLYDFYRLRNADRLALQDIGAERLSQYELWCESLLADSVGHAVEEEALFLNLQKLAGIFQLFLNGAPADHFSIDLNSGAVKDLTLEVNKQCP